MSGDGFALFMPAVNDGSAQSQGLELALAWQAADNLKLDLAYSFLDSNMERERQVGKEPKHQTSLRGFVNLRDDLDLHLWFRYVSSATTGYYVVRSIDEYATVDLRLAWRLTPEIELSLVGQNLLDEGRVEFEQNFWTRATEISRSVYGKLAYTF
jgi:iron complex outermembrane receptor protein